MSIDQPAAAPFDSDKRTIETRRLISLAIVLLIAALLCEGLIRVLVPTPIFYSSWFTSGVHQRDQQLGFVFRPHYVGEMRNSDRVWMEKIQLGPQGFRQPAVRDEDDDPDSTHRMVLLGGASMAFCYGLPDPECLHQQVADRLKQDSHIELISWPGFNLAQDMHKLQRFRNANEFDSAVLFAYDDQDYLAKANWQQLPVVGEFRMVDSVVMPNDPAATLAGGLYYRSRVIAGLCRAAQVPGKVFTRLGIGSSGEREEPNRVSEMIPAGMPTIYSAAARLGELGIDSIWIVALPHQQNGPVTALPAAPPNVVDVIDLRDQPQREDFDWIAHGHYGPQSVEHLADAIAEKLNARP